MGGERRTCITTTERRTLTIQGRFCPGGWHPFGADKLRKGNRTVLFPRGCFPPALPFVGG